MDDYAERPYYATLMRIIKYLAFFLTILLPGSYVAAVNFHPELIPDQLLFRIAQAERDMAFPLMFQALLIHFIYELMRGGRFASAPSGGACGEHHRRPGHRRCSGHRRAD